MQVSFVQHLPWYHDFVVSVHKIVAYNGYLYSSGVEKRELLQNKSNCIPNVTNNLLKKMISDNYISKKLSLKTSVDALVFQS